MHPASPLFKVLAIVGVLSALASASLCLIVILPFLGGWTERNPGIAFTAFFAGLVAWFSYSVRSTRRNSTKRNGGDNPPPADMRIPLPPKTPFGGLKASSQTPELS